MSHPRSDLASEAYEIRNGLTLKTGLLIALSVLFVLAAVFGGMGLFWRIVGAGFFGLCTVVLVIQAAAGRLALRVDAVGVTLGGASIGPRRSETTLPWQDIRRVVLFKQQTLYNKLPYVGIETVIPEPPSSATKIANVLVPQVPPDVIAHARSVAGCRVDHDQLRAAVGRFAPQVEVIDVG